MKIVGAVALVLMGGLALGWSQPLSPCPGFGAGMAQYRLRVNSIECWQSVHDLTSWHPLTEEIGHLHNGDPNLVNDILGPPGAWHNGQSISYPWQAWMGLDGGAAPQPGQMENDMKHEGYKWAVANDGRDCYQKENEVGTNCFYAWRIQYHSAGASHGAVTRLHSFSLEAQVCTPDFATCGIIRTGGLIDYGPLSLRPPWPPVRVILPDDPPEFDDHSMTDVPYKHHRVIGGSPTNYLWQSGSKFGYNLIANFAFHVHDDWQGVDPADPGRVELVCPDFQCESNHSNVGFYRIYLLRKRPNINEDLVDGIDGIIDGVMNFSGYTDRFGNLVPDCSPLGPDCIPLILENFPVGQASYWVPALPENNTEYDISPPGEFWIRYPN